MLLSLERQMSIHYMILLTWLKCLKFFPIRIGGNVVGMSTLPLWRGDWEEAGIWGWSSAIV